jgi:hypothetical protein
MLGRNIGGLVLVGLLASCAAGNQYGQYDPGVGQQPTVAAPYGDVPAGTMLWAQLDTPISATANQAGDQFTAVVGEDVRSSQGEVLIPAGSRVVGRIAELDPGQGTQPASVRLSVEALDMQGASQPLEGHIVQADVPQAQGQVRGRDVAIGAGAGAVLGAILGGVKGAVVGGIAGAGAGTLISLGLSQGHQALPAGTQISVQLDRPVRSFAAMRGRYY